MPQRRTCLLVALSVFLLGKGPCPTLHTELKRLDIYTVPKEAALWVRETGTGTCHDSAETWLHVPDGPAKFTGWERSEDIGRDLDGQEENTLVILSEE